LSIALLQRDRSRACLEIAASAEALARTAEELKRMIERVKLEA
jgi:hypothetical protein